MRLSISIGVLFRKIVLKSNHSGFLQNELAVLEFIHSLVETMDKYFESVCELDVSTVEQNPSDIQNYFWSSLYWTWLLIYMNEAFKCRFSSADLISDNVPYWEGSLHSGWDGSQRGYRGEQQSQRAEAFSTHGYHNWQVVSSHVDGVDDDYISNWRDIKGI
jgi:Clathrin adaptor complex small chain